MKEEEEEEKIMFCKFEGTPKLESRLFKINLIIKKIDAYYFHNYFKKLNNFK